MHFTRKKSNIKLLKQRGLKFGMAILAMTTIGRRFQGLRPFAMDLIFAWLNLRLKVQVYF